MTGFNVFLVSAAGLIALIALFAVPLKRHIAPPLIGLITGIALAFSPAHLLLSEDMMPVLEQVTRVSLAVGLMASALRVKRSEIRSEWKYTAVLLVFLMPLMWLFSGLAAHLTFGTGILTAMLIGAAVTPTDPVVAGSIVTGDLAEEKIHPRVRALVSLESGANDGLNYVFVFLPLLLLQYTPIVAAREWFVTILLWNVAGAVVAGLLIGYVSSQVCLWAERHEKRGPTYILIFTTALALFALAAIELVGMDGILGVFAAGLVFDYRLEASNVASPEEVQEAIDLLFTAPTFVLIGMALPWNEWGELGWKAVAFAGAITFLRRLPGVAILVPILSRSYSWRQQVLLAGAGPIGIASVLRSAYRPQTALA